MAIVVFHVVLWDYTPLTAGRRPYLHPLWQRQGEILGSVRIPMLLLLSGLLASSKVRAGFKMPDAARSMVVNYYFYALWLVIYFAVFLLIGIQVPHKFSTLPALVRELVIPGTTLWYIFALVIYTLLLTLLHRVPGWLVLAALLVMTVLVPESLSVGGMWEKIIHSLIFFAVGVYAAPVLRRADTWIRWWHSIPLAVAAAASLWASGEVPWQLVHNVLYLVFNFTAAALMLWGVMVLCRLRVVRRFLTFIGTRTLAIYVVHAPLIYLLMVIDHRLWPRQFASLSRNPALMSLYPVAMAAAIITVCLLIERVTRHRVPFLFHAPRWLTSRMQPASSETTSHPAG